MYNWNQNPDDDSWTELDPRQQPGRRRLLNPVVLALVAALILVVVITTVSFGYVSLGWFGSNQSPIIGQAATATPSLTATLAPTAKPSPSPTPRPSPTAKPSPTPKPPSPAILSVTPRTIFITNCPLNTTQRTRFCTFTLRNSSSTSPLAWKAKASNSFGLNATRFLSATSGTLPKSGKTTVTLFVNPETGVCTVGGTTVFIQFTGPKNTVTVTVTC